MTESNSKAEKLYELAFLLHNEEAQTGLFDVLKKHGASVEHQSSVFSIKLAYPIKKQLSAFFGFCYFKAGAEEVPKIKKELELQDSILRFLLITPPIKSVTPQPRPTKTSESAAPKTPTTQQAETSLSNEALEQKLEEILQ